MNHTTSDIIIEFPRYSIYGDRNTLLQYNYVSLPYVHTYTYIPSMTASFRTLALRLSVGKCFNFCCKSFLLLVISSTAKVGYQSRSSYRIYSPLFLKSAISFIFSPKAACSSVSLHRYTPVYRSNRFKSSIRKGNFSGYYSVPNLTTLLSSLSIC